MRIGALNKVIELQKPTETTDNMGGYTTTYATQYTVFAAIWPISASDHVKSEQMIGIVTHKIRIRYNSELKSKWRIKFGSRYFTIVAPPINTNEGNRQLELLCKEVEAS